MCMPIDCKYSLRNFICVHVMHIYIGFNAICVITTLDTINIMFIYHFVGHIHILKYNLSKLGQMNSTNKKLDNSLLIILNIIRFL